MELHWFLEAALAAIGYGLLAGCFLAGVATPVMLGAVGVDWLDQHLKKQLHTKEG